VPVLEGSLRALELHRRPRHGWHHGPPPPGDARTISSANGAAGSSSPLPPHEAREVVQKPGAAMLGTVLVSLSLVGFLDSV